MSLTPATNRQLPDNSILDQYNKQTYLGNAYGYSLNSESLATTETALLLLQNPISAANAFPTGYQGIFLNLKSLVCLTASQSAVLRVYLGPTFSAAGTPATPTNLRPASSNTSIATLTTSPTVSANGTLLEVLSSVPGERDQSQLMMILDQGKTLLFTIQTSSNTTFIATQLAWYEL